MLQSMLEICERKVSNTQSSESHVGALVARLDPRPQSFAEQLAARVAGLQTGAASPHVTRRSLSSSGSIERSADLICGRGMPAKHGHAAARLECYGASRSVAVAGSPSSKPHIGVVRIWSIAATAGALLLA